jgi:hypothetical protein
LQRDIGFTFNIGFTSLSLSLSLSYDLGMTKFESDLRYATVAGQCGSIGLQMWVMLQLKLLGTPWRGYGSYSSTFTFVSTAISTSESALVHLICAKTPDV